MSEIELVGGLIHLDTDRAEVLPDSRTRDLRGLVFISGEAWQPIFCANCAREGGLVPVSNMTFAFWLCNECFEKCGELTCTCVTPDDVFWAQVQQEQLEAYGRLLTEPELASVVAAGASPLATLIREREPGRNP